MQLTIDSSQPLEDVLRVVGAMYNVDLAAAPANGKANGHRPPRQRSSTRKRRTQPPSTAEVRAWALSQGYDVGSKGRIADAIVDAYRSAG